MEKSLFNSDKLDSFADALLCSPSIYIWRYSYDGSLSETNCPEHVYHRIFEHTGCLSYMINGAAERTPLILGAALGILWAAVYEWEEDALKWCYVIGPVFHNEVSNELLSDAIRRYHIDPSWRPAFVRAMHGIPAASSILFFQYAVMLHCIVTGEKLSRSDLRFQHHEETDRGMISVPHSNRHLTYQAEQALLQLIRDGDLNYRGAMEKAGLISSGVGISTNDPVKRAILSASNFTALCTRAAIEGGLTPDTAYTVGDSYIQSLTECRTIVDVRTVNHTMYEDFIQRVHKLRTNPEYSKQIQSCIDYIELHLAEKLSIRRLAERVGYTEYYLSHKFKEETGSSISSYIRYARIERAKSLLTATDLSVSQIAEQLQFCSSSYFSSKFQEVTGMLPNQYRKEKQRL